MSAEAVPSHDYGEGGGACYSTSFVGDTRTIQAVHSSTPLAPCPPDVSCVQTTSGTGSGATLIDSNGTFSPGPPTAPDYWGTEVQVMPGPGGGGDSPALRTTTTPDPNGCHDGGPPDPRGVLDFMLTGSSSSVKFVVYSLDPTVYPKPVSKYNVCWDQDTKFTPKGGGPQVFRGYLPNCGFSDDRWERWERDDGRRRSGPPCILVRFSTSRAKYIVVIAPVDAYGNDPRGYAGP